MAVSAPMPPMMILEQLKKAKSDKKIDSIITKAWESDSQEFFLGLQYSIDPLYDYKVSKVPEWDLDGQPDDGSGDFTFEEFYKLTQFICFSKLITIEEIDKAIIDAAQKANMTEWNLFYRKIILKKLHKELKMDVIAKSISRLTNQSKLATVTHKKANDSSDASIVLSRK